MTREYILQNLEIMCPIMFIDNPGLRDYVMSTLQDSLLIPKPKFKVGDVVSIPSGYSNGFTIFSRVYSPEKNMWFYSPNYEDNNSSMFLRLPELPAPEECFAESELELVEEKK